MARGRTLAEFQKESFPTEVALRDIFVCAALAEGVCLSHVRQGARWSL